MDLGEVFEDLGGFPVVWTRPLSCISIEHESNAMDGLVFKKRKRVWVKRNATVQIIFGSPR